jgi:hypothetical protein
MSKEKRLNKQLLSYWNQLKTAENLAPLKNSLNPDDISELWDNCFLIDTKTKKYTHLGENLLAMSNGKSVIAKDVYESVICTEKSNILSIVEEVIHSGQPIVQDSSFESKYGITVKYRRCFLPLLNEKNEIAHILGGARWKSFS